jgi:uncharacterized membrane protein YedE/YeeE
MARSSRRSIIAVVTFMGMAILAAVLTSPLASFASHTEFLRGEENGFGLAKVELLGSLITAFMVVVAFVALFKLLVSSNVSSNAHKERSSGEEKSDNICYGTPEVLEQALSNDSEIQPSTEAYHDALHQEAEEQKEASAPVSECDNVQASNKSAEKLKILPSVIAGAIFSCGLAVSEMVLPSKSWGFLDFSRIPKGIFDPTLAVVMAGGVIVSCISYQFVSGWSFFNHRMVLDCPLVAKESKFNIPANTSIDFKLIFGAASFGVGWGVSGICPGPAFFMAANGVQSVVYIYFPAYFIGSFAAKWIPEWLARRSRETVK